MELLRGFVVKGYMYGNVYFIKKNKNKSFSIYQLFREVNKHLDIENIKTIFPLMESLSDMELIISIPRESYKAFLIIHNVDIREMMAFRKNFEKEELFIFK